MPRGAASGTRRRQVPSDSGAGGVTRASTWGWDGPPPRRYTNGREVCVQTGWDASTLPASGAADEAAVLREILAGCEEDASQRQRRADALALLQCALRAWAEDESSRAVVYGSVAFNVHLPGADSDVLCATSSPKHARFFEEFPGFLKAWDPVRVGAARAIPDAMPPIVKAKILGVPHDILFCYVAAWAGRPLPAHLDLSDPQYLVGMDVSSRRSTGGPQLAALLRDAVPNRATCATVLRCVKLWAARRGVAGRPFGYPGGVSWLALVCAACRRSPPSASALTVLRTFFEMYRGSALCAPVAMVEVPTSWRRGPSDKLAILVPFPTPAGTPMQLGNSCCGTECTLAALRVELDRAAFLFSRVGRIPEIWYPADFFASYGRFVEIKFGAADGTLLDAWQASVVSRFRDAMNHVDNFVATASDFLLARPWPAVFRGAAGAPHGCEPVVGGDHTAFIYVGVAPNAVVLKQAAGDPDVNAVVADETAGLVGVLQSGFADLLADWGARRQGMFAPLVSVCGAEDVPWALRTQQWARAVCVPRPMQQLGGGRSGRHRVPHATRAPGRAAGEVDTGETAWLQEGPEPTRSRRGMREPTAWEGRVPHGALRGDGDAALRASSAGAPGGGRDIADTVAWGAPPAPAVGDAATSRVPSPTAWCDATSHGGAAVYATTVCEIRLRALPDEELCVWAPGVPAVPMGSAVAVVSIAGTMALVRWQACEGFARVACLSTAPAYLN